VTVTSSRAAAASRSRAGGSRTATVTGRRWYAARGGQRRAGASRRRRGSAAPPARGPVRCATDARPGEGSHHAGRRCCARVGGRREHHPRVGGAHPRASGWISRAAAARRAWRHGQRQPGPLRPALAGTRRAAARCRT
jgi:hypothetical protein